ncbi:MAG TPA: DUF4252 domain-containing protein [Thermoanaerobaculia bacterium]|nr:DUF4252 domain-containing protein [Thermoanaerobaculia bacterium]
MPLALALLAALPLAGCLDTPSVGEVEAEIEGHLPGASFERESHVHVGRLMMGFARWVIHLVPADDDDTKRAFAMVRNVHSVDVATYKVRSLAAVEPAAWSPDFERRLEQNGWSVVVRAKERDSSTWIFYRGNGADTITNLYIVNLEPAELNIIRVDGRLERVIALALADHPGHMSRMLGGGSTRD